MLKTYFKIAWRNLLKSKMYSAINITGLAAGMAIAMLIGLWIKDEWTFDKNFENYQHIAQVWQNVSGNGEVATWGTTPQPLGVELRKNYGSDFKYVSMTTWEQMHVLSIGEKNISRVGMYGEPALSKILSLKMLKGSDERLKDPQSILLSESLAKSIFGDADPIDKTFKVDNKVAVIVTGVYKDIPSNSSFGDVSYIMPWEQYVKTEGLDKDDNPWRANSFRTLVQLADNADMAKVSAKIRDIKMHNVRSDELTMHPQLFLHPMPRWHLYSEYKNGMNTGGLIRYVWLFGISGVFVLLLACINFMNLSTARSEKRAKEVGIRKSIGSQRGQLIFQFFSESLLMVFIALLVSLVLVQLLLPLFNGVASKNISILWSDPLFWLVCMAFCFVTALVAGSYPAFYLSSFRPIKVLKGTYKMGKAAAIPRKVLVVLQFTVSVVLIIATIVVFRQIEFAKNRPVGYNRNGLLMVPMITSEIHNHFDVVKTELLKSGTIVNMAESMSPVTSVWSTNSGFNWEGKDPTLALDFPNESVTYDYGKTLGWKFVAGRDFSRSFATDSAAFVINEAAAKFMHLKDPVGKIMTWDGRPYTIIGIIKDVISESPFAAVRPSLFNLNTGAGLHIILRLNPSVSTSDAMAKIESVFKTYNPTQPFDYQFVDQQYARKFGDEQRFGKLSGIFSILAIFISCLGLFGMASFMAEQRTKEIGVRKVLGATLFNLWRLLSTDFVTLIFISLCIAFPLAYFSMNSWLQNYEYHTTIAWWIFAVAGFGALSITLLTVSYQAIRVALMNPVKSLRSE